LSNPENKRDDVTRRNTILYSLVLFIGYTNGFEATMELKLNGYCFIVHRLNVSWVQPRRKRQLNSLKKVKRWSWKFTT